MKIKSTFIAHFYCNHDYKLLYDTKIAQVMPVECFPILTLI